MARPQAEWNVGCKSYQLTDYIFNINILILSTLLGIFFQWLKDSTWLPFQEHLLKENWSTLQFFFPVSIPKSLQFINCKIFIQLEWSILTFTKQYSTFHLQNLIFKSNVDFSSGLQETNHIPSALGPYPQMWSYHVSSPLLTW